jgi:t-SNARE complex subunit (syntaxin)
MPSVRGGGAPRGRSWPAVLGIAVIAISVIVAVVTVIVSVITSM